MTVVEDALDDVTTYTYSATQPGMLTAETAPAPVGDCELHARQLPVRFAGPTDDHHQRRQRRHGQAVYSSAGQVTEVTDPNGMETTYSL